MHNKAVVCDLDGTLVRAFPEGDITRGPRTVEETQILPGTQESVQAIQDAGFLAICVTNQPGLARLEVDLDEHDLIRCLVRLRLPKLRFYRCHHDGEWCACRKPRPGLIYKAAVDLELDLSRCWMIGDRETDREAAIRAGIPPSQAIKIETNQGIGDATAWILQNSK